MQSGIVSKASKSLVAYRKNRLLVKKETSFSLHEKQTHLQLEDAILIPLASLEILFEAPAWHCGSVAQRGAEVSIDKKGEQCLLACGAPPTTHASVIEPSTELGGFVGKLGPQMPGREAVSVKMNKTHLFLESIEIIYCIT